MPHEESRYAGPVAVVEKLAPGEFLVDVVVEYVRTCRISAKDANAARRQAQDRCGDELAAAIPQAGGITLKVYTRTEK